jgi:hypothetical protein
MIAIEWMWTKRLAVSWHKSTFVQAVGMVNHRVVDRFRYYEVQT